MSDGAAIVRLEEEQITALHIVEVGYLFPACGLAQACRIQATRIDICLAQTIDHEARTVEGIRSALAEDIWIAKLFFRNADQLIDAPLRRGSLCKRRLLLLLRNDLLLFCIGNARVGRVIASSVFSPAFPSLVR